jgi:NAD-dependent SIR2 family protein deacetylase
VAWIVGALEGAVVFGGLSAIGAGLYGMGIPKDSVIQYEMALKTDNFLLMVHGTSQEVAKAKEIIEGTSPINIGLHSIKSVELATV